LLEALRHRQHLYGTATLKQLATALLYDNAYLPQFQQKTSKK